LDLWAAIPDSALVDEQTKRDKSIKIAQFARAFSIFKVSKVFIYRDKERDYGTDRILLKLLLEFLDTPQYLRRRLYPRREELQFAGLLHPLKAPHHKPAIDPSKIKVGEIRQAVVAKVKGQYFADAGLNALIPVEGSAPTGKRVTIRFVSEHPKLRCKAIPNEEIKEYWGYEVKEVQSLTDLLNSIKGSIILTSKEGEPLGAVEQELTRELRSTPSALVVFGSPNRGLRSILKDESKHPREFTKYFLNFFPNQATETVRLEEAVICCLSLLNYLFHK
jgi:predicted SPOUT superfamily RNA methylase MTH1